MAARRYDAVTEEVSPDIVDEMTAQHLDTSVRKNQLATSRVVPSSYMPDEK